MCVSGNPTEEAGSGDAVSIFLLCTAFPSTALGAGTQPPAPWLPGRSLLPAPVLQMRTPRVLSEPRAPQPGSWSEALFAAPRLPRSYPVSSVTCVTKRVLESMGKAVLGPLPRAWRGCHSVSGWVESWELGSRWWASAKGGTRSGDATKTHPPGRPRVARAALSTAQGRGGVRLGRSSEERGLPILAPLPHPGAAHILLLLSQRGTECLG